VSSVYDARGGIVAEISSAFSNFVGVVGSSTKSVSNIMCIGTNFKLFERLEIFPVSVDIPFGFVVHSKPFLLFDSQDNIFNFTG